MSRLVFYFFFGVLTLNLWAGECEEKQARYILNKKTVQFKDVFCLKENKANSLNCQLMLMKNCPFSQLKKDVSVKDMLTPVGSPGFRLCHFLGGNPQLYELEMAKGEWKPYARCLWPESREFVDLADLVAHYP